MIYDNESITVNGMLIMTGGIGHWFQVTPKTALQETNFVALPLGLADAGKMWFNTATLQLNMWDGTIVVIVG